MALSNKLQEQIFTTTQVQNILNEELVDFSKKWHGVMKMSDLQTLSKFIEQVKEKINEPVNNQA